MFISLNSKRRSKWNGYLTGAVPKLNLDCPKMITLLRLLISCYALLSISILFAGGKFSGKHEPWYEEYTMMIEPGVSVGNQVSNFKFVIFTHGYSERNLYYLLNVQISPRYTRQLDNHNDSYTVYRETRFMIGLGLRKLLPVNDQMAFYINSYINFTWGNWAGTHLNPTEGAVPVLNVGFTFFKTRFHPYIGYQGIYNPDYIGKTIHQLDFGITYVKDFG